MKSFLKRTWTLATHFRHNDRKHDSDPSEKRATTVTAQHHDSDTGSGGLHGGDGMDLSKPKVDLGQAGKRATLGHIDLLTRTLEKPNETPAASPTSTPAGSASWHQMREDWLTPDPAVQRGPTPAVKIDGDAMFDTLNDFPYRPLPAPIGLQQMIALLNAYGMLEEE